MTNIAPSAVRAIATAVRRRGASLTALADAAATRFRGRTALVVGDERWRFEELWRATEGIAAALYVRELDRRPRTIIAACEGHALVLTVLAAGRLGLDVMLANPRRVGADLEELASPGALLVHDGERPAWHDGPAIPCHELLAYARVDGSGLARTSRRSRTIMLTSGTTGRPTTHATRPFSLRGLMQLRGLHERVGIAGTDTVLACSPLHHGHGLQLLAASLLTGATLVSAPYTSPERRLEIVRSEGVTVMSGLPVQFERMVDHLEAAGEAAPPLRRILSGSQRLDASLVTRLHAAWGPIVANAYGMTETGTIAVASPAMMAAHPGTVGTPLPGVELGIVGFPGGKDATGRIWVRAAGRTVITSDRGAIRDGMLYVTGRYDD